MSAASFAQNLPTDGANWPGPSGTWTGDTIINNPNFPIGGSGGNHAPSFNSSVIAVCYKGFIYISTPSSTNFSYVLYDEQHINCLRGEAAEPTLINITTLPPGRYTLLLYINNECLEGEFEKEF